MEFNAVASPFLVPFDRSFSISQASSNPPAGAGDKHQNKARLKDLVDELREDETPREDFKWVPLHSFKGPVYAEMAKETLEKNDIPCLLKRDFLSGAYGTQGTTDWGLDTFIFVPEGRVKESEELLRAMTGKKD